MTRDGRRPGAGRPPGPAGHPRSLRERFPILPLDHMLSAVNDETAPMHRRDEMAKAAAPYIHPRLSAVAI